MNNNIIFQRLTVKQIFWNDKISLVSNPKLRETVPIYQTGIVEN